MRYAGAESTAREQMLERKPQSSMETWSPEIALWPREVSTKGIGSTGVEALQLRLSLT